MGTMSSGSTAVQLVPLAQLLSSASGVFGRSSVTSAASICSANSRIFSRSASCVDSPFLRRSAWELPPFLLSRAAAACLEEALQSGQVRPNPSAVQASLP